MVGGQGIGRSNGLFKRGLRILKAGMIATLFVMAAFAGPVVSVSPSSATLLQGGSTTLTAVVTGTSNTAVTWSVDGIVNGNSTVGTLTILPNTPVVRQVYHTGSAKVQTGVNVVAGDLICVGWIVANSPGGANTSCSDSSGNTYTEVGGTGSNGYVFASAAGATIYQFYTIASATNSALTVTISSLNTNSVDLFIAVVTGMSSSQGTVLDAFANAAEASVTSNHSTGTLTTTLPNDFLFTLWGNDQWDGALTENSGFTLGAKNTGGANAVYYKIAGAAGAYSETMTSSPGMQQLSILAAFKAGVGNRVTYTAPAAGGSHTIVATSVADSAQSASSTMTVSSGVSVSVSPASANISPGGNGSFSSTVTGSSNTAVTWTVDGVPNGNSTSGTITYQTCTPSVRQTYHTTGTKIQTGINVVAGDLVCVGWVVGNSPNGANTSCSDSSGNSYTEVGGTGSSGYAYSAAAGATVYQFYTIAASNNPSLTLTISSLDTNSVDLYVVVVQGMSSDLATILDGYVNTTDPAAITSHTTGTLTTTNANEFVFSLWGNGAVAGTLSEGTSGFTLAAQDSANGTTAACFKIVGSAGGCSETMTSSVATVQANVMAAFKAGSTSNNVTYTAPATGGTHAIVATSVADATKSGSATVTSTMLRPPVLGAAPSPVFQPGVAKSFTLPIATDPNGSSLSYAVSGLPAGLVFNASTLVISGTIIAAGTYSFTYTVTDGLSLSTTGTITIVVKNSPVLGADITPVFQPGVAKSFTLPTATDQNGSSLSYVVSGLPAGLAFNASTLVISGTITATGTYPFSYTVTDGLNLSTTGTITIVVENSPVLGAAISPVFQPGVFKSFRLPAATGPDGSSLTYTVSGLPAGLVFDPSTQMVNGTLANTGTYPFTYTVTDGLNLSTTGTITITVLNPPVLGAAISPVFQSRVANSFTLPAATDPNGSSLSYVVSGLPAGLVFHAPTLLISGTINNTGSYPFTYTVTDGLFLSTTGIITITVDNPPVLGATISPWFQAGIPGSCTLPIATAPNGAGLSYAVAGLPAGLSFNASSRLISGMVDVTGIYPVSYTVTDSHNLSTTGNFTISVAGLPVLGATPSPVFINRRSNSFTLPTATDPIGSPLTYQVLGLPAGLSYNATSHQISGTINRVGSYTFTYTVSNGFSLTSSASITITVNPITPVPLAFSATTNYTYDPTTGFIKTIAYPSNNLISYGYDQKNRIHSVTLNNNQSIISNIVFDEWSNISETSYGSGAIDQWIYDPDSRGTQLSSWTVSKVGAFSQTWSYDYDSLNRLSQAGDWNGLQYDLNSRLTSATGLGFTATYDYDIYGNNKSSSPSPTGNMNSFSFNPALDNQIPSITSDGKVTGFIPTPYGEIKQVSIGMGQQDIYFTWDDLGRLATSQFTQDSNPVTEYYSYAASGLRIIRTNNDNPTLNQLYAYSSDGLLMSVFTDNNGALAWNRDVVYVGGRAVAELDSAMVHELHSDYQGTPLIITSLADPPGYVNGVQAYAPFGERITNPAYSSGYVPIIGYTGHLQTEANGNLIYMRGRFYSPAWHRFLNSDQGADPSQLNQFAYAGGSPMMATDPSGMWLICGENGKVAGNTGSPFGGSIDGIPYGSSFLNSFIGNFSQFGNMGSLGSTMLGYAAGNAMSNSAPTGQTHSTGPTLIPSSVAQSGLTYQGGGPGWAQVSCVLDIGLAWANIDAALLSQTSQPNPGNSLYNRFLDGYQNAPKDAPLASKIANTVSTVQTFTTKMTYENLANAAACDAAGWQAGSTVFINGMLWESVILPALALHGAVEVGKITAGITNMFIDAY